MGTVYRARDETSGRQVALKLLSKNLSQRARERLLREGQLTAALRHPGIVRIHSAGTSQGLPYLAYELIEGGQTLDDVLPQRDLRQRVELIRDVAAAVGYAHQNGVVHRDLKPENVLLDPSGRPRVADFGLAWSEGVDSLTRTGALLGTPTSMAPEQITGKKDAIGPWTDVWALGVMLYRALTGELPFDRSSLVELSVAICEATPAAPRSLRPDLSPDLERICLRALAGDPAARYADGSLLAADLDNHLASRPVSASSLGSRLSAIPARRRWAVAVCLAAGLGLTLAVVSALVATQPQPPPPVASTPALAGPERLLADARAHLVDGDPTAAAQAAEAYVAQRPGNPDAWRLLALARAELGERQPALDASQRAAALSGPIAAAIVSAEILAAVGDDPLPAFASARRRWPKDTRVPAAWAQYLLAHRHAPYAAALILREGPLDARSQDTLTLVEGLLEHPPALPPGEIRVVDRPWVLAWLTREGRHQLALAQRQHDRRFRLDRPDLAEEALARAEALFRCALSLEPDAAAAAVAHAGLAWRFGLESDAAASHLETLASAGTLPSFAASTLTRAWLLRGDPRAAAALEAAATPPLDSELLSGWIALDDDPAAALELLDRAWAPRRDDPHVCALLLRACERLGLSERVEALRERAQVLAGELAAEASEVLSRVGGSNIRTVDDETAYNSLDAVLALDPHNTRALLERGKVGVSRGALKIGASQAELKQSFPILVEAVRRNPSTMEDVQISLYSFTHASELLSGDAILHRLFEGYDHSETFEGRRARAYSYAWIAEIEREEDPALLWAGVRAFDEVLTHDPGDVTARAYRGFLHIRLGHLAQASADIRAAQRVLPDDPLLAFYELLVLAKAGRPHVDVVAAFERAVAASRDDFDRQGWSLSRYPEMAPYLDAPELSGYVR
jgi:predicted Zn-dependent protease